MSFIVKVGSDPRIYIPKDTMEALNIKEGDFIEVTVKKVVKG